MLIFCLSSPPVVRPHATVDHANVFSDRLHFVDTLLIIQNGLLFLLCGKDNSIGGWKQREHHNQYPEKLNDSKGGKTGKTKSQTDYFQLIVFCFNLTFANKCNEIMNNPKYALSSENIKNLNKCEALDFNSI